MSIPKIGERQLLRWVVRVEIIRARILAVWLACLFAIFKVRSLFHSLKIVVWLIKHSFLLPSLQHESGLVLDLLTSRLGSLRLPRFVFLPPFTINLYIRGANFIVMRTVFGLDTD